MSKMLKYLIVLLTFNFINLQYGYNELNFLICGEGIETTPDLIEYENSIEKEISYSPIRIFIDYSNFDNTISSFTNIEKSKDLIKEKLSKAANLMEQIVKVKRFKNNLFIPDEIISQHNLTKYNSSIYSGISYDLIIFLKFQNKKQVIINEGTKFVNFQGFPVIIDSNTKRPITGILNIYNLDYSEMSNSETYFLNSFIHQLIHIMVFDTQLIKSFPNYESPPYIRGYDYTSFQIRNFINSPKVLQYGKRHFQCENNFKGLQIDNTGFKFINLDSNLYHWEQRFMNGDIMIPVQYEEQSISEITLALFEDSNWYEINYYTGGLFRFGKGKKCWFSNFPCFNDYYISENDFCDVNNQLRCTSGRLQKGICRLYNYNSIPEYFQYFDDDITLGGNYNAHYCPKTEKEYMGTSSFNNFYPGSCVNGYIPQYSKDSGEINSDHSFCVISNVIPNDNNYSIYNQRRAICFPMSCSKTILTIQVGDYYYTCPKNGGIINVQRSSGYLGDIECPDYNLICTGSVLCNNIADCIEKKSIYNENTFIYNELPFVYQDLNNLNGYYSKNIGETSNNGKCGLNCIFCNNINTCLKCREGDYAIASKSKDRGVTTKLYCNLISNLESENYVLENNVYYPTDDTIDTDQNDDTTETDQNDDTTDTDQNDDTTTDTTQNDDTTNTDQNDDKNNHSNNLSMILNEFLTLLFFI